MPIGNCRLPIGGLFKLTADPTAKTMNADELKKRTKQFALRILKLVAALPKTVQGRTIGGQLARSGTSVGANYRAACRGRSKAEFIAKIGVVEEEADESGYWLELIIEDELLKKDLVQPLLDEANALTKIMGKSRITASDHQKVEGRELRAARRSGNSNRQSAIGNRQ